MKVILWKGTYRLEDLDAKTRSKTLERGTLEEIFSVAAGYVDQQ